MKYLIASVLLAATLYVQAEEKKDEYPLRICIVSGEELGEHGEPFVYKYKGQEVRFCCKDCLGDFEEDPELYLKLIEDARKQAATNEVVELKHEDHSHTREDAAGKE